ncbi:MAG: hypothetical protein ACRCWL_03140 [Aeromonas sp.]
MDIRLYQRNYREDLAQAMEQEKAGRFIDAALSYKKAQHHAASANLLENARFAMARRIRCLKMAGDREWTQVNDKFQKLYLSPEIN